jgi:hypothetical protein
MSAVLPRLLNRSLDGNDNDLSLALKPIHACLFQTFLTCVKQSCSRNIVRSSIGASKCDYLKGAHTH